MATNAATRAYRERFQGAFGRAYFRRFADSVVSSIGIGTYLGEPTDAVDDRYRGAITEAIENGINVIDTAINYRHQRSERAVGAAVSAADVDREALLLATKGGFIPFDGSQPADPGQYIRSEYLDSGLIDRADLVRGSHCLAPAFIDDQLDRSLANLDVETIDLYYVHNPETQLEAHDRTTVYDQLEAIFEQLERRVNAGDIRHYGVATWNAFRVHTEHKHYLSLAEVIGRARSAAETVGNDASHLRAVQLPFNVEMADAFTVTAQSGAEGDQSALWFAREADIDVFTSASIGQGALAEELPPSVAAELAGDSTVQRAINFARSAPGVTAALVGMSRPEHVVENVAAGTFAPMDADAFDAVFE
ncbi:MAG: aldo/keto reductase [Halobacteriales archaeon]